MAPGSGIKAPVSRTRNGCLTCRKGKVKCDEERPSCKRCRRLQLDCAWSEVASRCLTVSRRPSEIETITSSGPVIPPFVVEFPNADRASLPYIKHFINFCSRFLVYADDGDANPFQQELVPLASSSPALLHSMIALAAGHMARTDPRHGIFAVKHYTVALRELNRVLSEPGRLASNSTLGACLMLCVYEISHSGRSLWLKHLRGARDLIIHRGGPRATDFLSRFFSLLDISGSLLSGRGPLIQGNYWLEGGQSGNGTLNQVGLQWPYYDDGAIMVGAFHELMVYMACLSSLSADSMAESGRRNPDLMYARAMSIREGLQAWWESQPAHLRDQSNDWRSLPRERPMGKAEVLEQEAFSSIRSCTSACIIYLHHIINPIDDIPRGPEVSSAIESILAIVRKTPEGRGLEMGLLWGLFMAGVVISDDAEAEALIRRKLRSDASISIYHADRGLELLEVLWERQRRLQAKLDWREIQKELGFQVYVFALAKSFGLSLTELLQFHPCLRQARSRRLVAANMDLGQR
ncbi:hypothetical protein CC79DRAFT_680116 [Sarocladium strictum]